MKKMVWFTLLLAGCGRHYRHYPEFTAGSAPTRIVAVSAEPVAPVANANPATEGIGALLDSPPETILKHPPNIGGGLQDVYFAYDQAGLSEEALAVLRHDAQVLCAALLDFPGLRFVIEGHCDERGSAEYNLALGDRRAQRVEEVLREYGVPAAAVEVVSYGKESPQCTEETESCWQKNRRAHISVRRAP